MSAADAILDWASGRPEWQQDALRRLVAAPNLDDVDLAELVEICKRPFGIAKSDVVPRPITRDHLFDHEEERAAVTLLAVADVKNAYAIGSETPLTIADRGLTVVYGANGAGKSGYVRVLKQVCRARGETPQVLPNVYEGDPDAPASARLIYSQDSMEVEYTWELGDEGPDALRAVSIFDHECAAIYTDEKCDVAYLPFGLDLLPRLADVATEMRRRLDREIKDLEGRAMALPEVPEGTTASALLGDLDRDDARSRIEQYAVFGSDDQQRLEELNGRLSENDPRRRAAELDARADRIGDLLRDIEQATPLVSATQVAVFREALRQQESARRAADLAASEAFATEPVPGTGTDPWRTLWNAARQFSEEVARVDKPYPPAEGEHCLLCQQAIDGEAADRLRRFESFVRSEVEKKADEAAAEVERIRGQFALDLSLAADSIRSDLELEAPDLFAGVEQLTKQLRNRLEAILRTETEEDLADLPGLPDTQALDKLRALHRKMRSQAVEHRAASEATERVELERERAELEGKRLLAERRDDLLSEVERRATLRKLRAARRTTDTTGITRKNTELTEAFVTERLAASFVDELGKLRLDHLPIQVAKSGGESGTAYHQVELQAARDLRIRPGRVLSSGEHRCVALAAFFAELSTQPGASTVVFDDPVSSLDHDRREYVAGRLVAIAQDRPVLIFTHDLVFTLSLQRIARERNVPMRCARLLREGRRAGRVAEDLPWQGISVGKRIGVLRRMHQEAAAIYRRGDLEEYERRVKEIYGYLRETWERGVEDVLLNEAVQRFSPEVNTRRLRYLARISDDYLDTLERGMSKSSRWLPGHDDARAATDPVPDPAEVLQDIEQLDAWRKDLKRIHDGRS